MKSTPRLIRLLLALAALFSTGTALFPGLARAEEEGGTGRIAFVPSNFKAFRQFLSGPAWLLAGGEVEGSDRRAILDSASEAPLSQGGGVLVPFRDPAPAFSRNILLTRDFSNTPIQTEPHIAVNPKDPKHLIAGVIDYAFPNISVYNSFDAGETWEGPFLTPYLKDDVTGAGDPVVSFDRQGNAYVSFISIGIEEVNVGAVVGQAEVSSIAISRSTDGGYTWSDPVSTARSEVQTDYTVDPDNRTRGTVNAGFLDKEWMTIGPNPRNAAQDIIYVTYTSFTDVSRVLYIDELPTLSTQEVHSVIQLVRSEDGGRTWSNPINVSPLVRQAAGQAPAPGEAGAVGLKRVVQGSAPAVGPDGTVYVAWMDSTDDESQKGIGEIYISRSDDGGRAFSRPLKAVTISEPGFTARRSLFRYWATAFPHVAIGTKGEVYIVYGARNPAKPVDDGEVWFMRSTDKGQSWSQSIILGGDRTNSLQFFPNLAVDPKGVLHVMWADMRDSKSQTAYHIYYTRSENQGQTWGFESRELNLRSEDARVTDFPSNPNRGFPGGRFIGDYFGIAATEEDVYMVWADTRLGEFGGVNQKIGFARRKAIPSPQVFISPPAGPAGQQITIQGFNLQPDLNVFIQAAGVTVAAERTNADGRFTASLYMPVAGQGAQSIRVLDESGNVANASFFTEFGFGDIKTTQDRLSQRLDTLSGAGLEKQLSDLNGRLTEFDTAATPWWITFIAALGAAIVAAVAASLITVAVVRKRNGTHATPGGQP